MQAGRSRKWSRRRYHRFRDPHLMLAVNKLRGRADDWSLGGVGLTVPVEQWDDFRVGSPVWGQLVPPKGGQPIEFAARVVHQQAESGRIGLEFNGLSEQAVDLFARVFRGMKQET